MSLSVYLIFLIVLLGFNLLFWVLVIWFRIFFGCGGCGASRRHPSDRRRGRNLEPGLGNPAFDNEDEDPARTRPRPYSITERMESPPSYEDAIKQEQFGFRIPTTSTDAQHRFEPSSLPILQNQIETEPTVGSREDDTPTQSSSSTENQAFAYSEATASCSRIHAYPARQLSTISEENDESLPVTVVIDNIGVHTARLLGDSLDPKIKLSDGEQLRNHSKC